MSIDPATALYTAAHVRALDRAAIETHGVAGREMMRRAAAAAWATLQRRWPDALRIGLLAGSGNNGGDAFLLGALARQAGCEVVAVAHGAASGADAADARDQFVAAVGEIVAVGDIAEWPLVDVWVDGLFGTGLKNKTEGAHALSIERVNASLAPVLALDVPSGLSSDTGCALGATIRADATVSFVGWKRGLFTADGADRCGALELATLHLPAAVYADVAPDAELLAVATLARSFPPRERNVHKGSFGHALAIGGDHGYAGAIGLTAEAALRSGAGLVSVATRSGNVSALNASRPELIAREVESIDALDPMIARADVIAIGPGLGTETWGRALWNAALDADKPTVLDADALNLLASGARKLPSSSVLTPHPGEAARLLGTSTSDVQDDRYAAARALAKRFDAIVVLKGAGSLIAAPDGRVAVCRWGNPGMATGGMGDVLTGVIAALLAQGLGPFAAAQLGVALHALAGDLAAGDAPRGLIASDLFEPLRRLANDLAAP